VARFIQEHPGAIQKHICQAMGIQASVAHWHVRRLQEAHIIDAIRQGRTVSYFPLQGVPQTSEA
jgi:predicted transcriptional regulator